MEEDLASRRLRAMSELQHQLAQSEKQNDNLNQNIVEAYELLGESNKEIKRLREENVRLAFEWQQAHDQNARLIRGFLEKRFPVEQMKREESGEKSAVSIA